MFVTWTALQLAEPSPTCPWQPEGARYSQAGQAGAGTAAMPTFDGTWWSVLSTWDDAGSAAAAAPDSSFGPSWHVVLQAVSFRGDARLAGGAQPFGELPERGRVTGAAAVITLAGFGPDPERTAEFFRRFVTLGRDIRAAPGHRASLVQAPEDGAVMTFSTWATLRDAVTWAYHRRPHHETVERQEQHQLLDTGGFVRCAVLSTHGTLAGIDPMAGLVGVAA